MKLYFLLDDEEPEAVADKLVAALGDWLATTPLELTVVDERPDDVTQWQIGLQFDCKRKAMLKQPLEFLFKWAKKMEREFVIGFYDKESGNNEDVCYFGYEEGCPALDEVGLYLGLKR